ncbi:24536_t:CDS:1, partial [Gigaspora margarita]
NREHTDYLLTLKQLKNKHDKCEFLYKEAIDRFETIKNGKEKDKEARAEA